MACGQSKKSHVDNKEIVQEIRKESH